MRRLAALLAAVAMVAAAVLLRGVITGGDDGGTADGGGSGALVLRCSSTMATSCARLRAVDGVRVVVEDDAVTAERLLATPPDERPRGVGAWLTVAPWPRMVDQDRAADGGGRVLGDASARLGRSPTVIVAQQDRADALAGACGGSVTWACIGSAAGEPWTTLGGPATWGAVKPGLPVPDRADGLVVLAQAVASELGTTRYASNDFDDDPDFRPWFDQLVGTAKDAPPSARTPLEQFLVLPQAFGAVGSLESEGGPAVARATGRDLAVIYPEPVVTGDVVLAPAAGSSAREVLDRLGRDRVLDALAGGGWRVPGRPQVDGVGGGPPLPATDALPAPGVLSALRQEWEAVP